MKYYQVFLLLIFCWGIYAQQPSGDTVFSKQLDEVVITAQYGPVSPEKTLYKVKTIDAKEIELQASTTLRDVLAQELNIDIYPHSVFGASIEMEGLSGENIKILIDGIPVTGRLNGILDLSQILLSNVERIEIVQGPASVFYGTDAAGGVINIITKKYQSKTFEGKISLQGESVKAAGINVESGYKHGKNIWRFNGANSYFHGLNTQENERTLNWPENNRAYLNLSYARQINRFNIICNSSYFNEKLWFLGEEKKGKIIDTDYITTRMDNTLSFKGRFRNGLLFMTDLALNKYLRFHKDYNVDPETMNKTLITGDPDENAVEFLYGEIRTQTGKNNSQARLNYAYGIDLIYDGAKGERFLHHSQNMNTIAMFGSINYALNRNWEIQPALRYTFNTAYGSLFTPAFHCKYNPGGNSSVRISYTRGFRAPSLKELYLDFHIGPFTISGNENLQAEKSHSIHIFYMQKIKPDDRQTWTVEPALFYNHISGLITLSQMVDNKRYYINIDRFRSAGGKVNISWKMDGRWKITTGIAYTGRSSGYSGTLTTAGFLFSPDISSNVLYTHKSTGIQCLLTYKYSGKRPGYYLNEENRLIKTVRKDFHNMNFSLSKQVLKNKLTTVAGIKNIFNVKDVETINEVGEAHVRDMQLWGRSFFVKLSYRIR